MVVIAIIAPALLILSWVDRVGRSLDNLYGEKGKIQSECRLSEAIATASDVLHQGRYAEAEELFRSALGLNRDIKALNAANGWSDYDRSDEILLGLADALARRGKPAEAEPLYREGLSLCERRVGRDHLAVADHLERYSSFLRRAGRCAEAKVLEDRALAIRLRVRLADDEG